MWSRVRRKVGERRAEVRGRGWLYSKIIWLLLSEKWGVITELWVEVWHSQYMLEKDPLGCYVESSLGEGETDLGSGPGSQSGSNCRGWTCSSSGGGEAWEESGPFLVQTNRIPWWIWFGMWGERSIKNIRKMVATSWDRKPESISKWLETSRFYQKTGRKEEDFLSVATWEAFVEFCSPAGN